jgi:hypothetical protein
MFGETVAPWEYDSLAPNVLDSQDVRPSTLLYEHDQLTKRRMDGLRKLAGIKAILILNIRG